MKIVLNRRPTAKFMLAVVVGLTAICIITQILVHGFGRRRLFGFVPLFDVGLDANVPTWWSSMALLFCSGLMALIAAEHRNRGDRSHRYWWGIAAVFCFFSMDETAMFHEHVGNTISFQGREMLGMPGNWGGATWIYAFIVPVLLFVIAYIPFYLRLPRRTQILLALAAVTLVGGGVGVETVAHAVYTSADREWLYQSVTVLEEFMEMLGVVILAYALIDYMTLAFGGIALRIDFGLGDTPADARPTAQHERTAPPENVT